MESAPPVLAQSFNGRQMDAYYKQVDIMRAVIGTQHRIKEKISLLDFGSGKYGVGRIIMRGLMKTDDSLSLFDPRIAIETPRDANVHIVTAEDVFGDARIAFDVIGISYVLCCMKPKKARAALMCLRKTQPQAVCIIVDYTLKNRTKMEILQLLTSRQEMLWRHDIGEKLFARTRRRFTRDSLEQFIRSAGFTVMGHAAPLDRAGIRAAIVTRPNRTISFEEQVPYGERVTDHSIP